MRQLIIIGFLILNGCGYKTIDTTADNLTLDEIAKGMTGNWKLKEIKTKKGIKKITESDTIQSYEFEGLKGYNEEMRDNHDGTFSTPTCQPICKLKEQNDKKIIEYADMGHKWELEIVSVTKDKLVLADSITTWTYLRHNNIESR